MYSTVIKMFSRIITIEEGSIQKARQTVVVLDWGARSNAAVEICCVKVQQHCVHSCCTFPFTIVGVKLYVHRFVFQVFNADFITTKSVQNQQKISGHERQIILNLQRFYKLSVAKPANTQYCIPYDCILCAHTEYSTIGLCSICQNAAKHLMKNQASII